MKQKFLQNPALDAVLNCIRLGVREFVLCPGARNAEIIAIIKSVPEICTYTHPEERAAAFFALGRTIQLDEPVAVVTTSGTAVAELLPAAVEAYCQSVPLVMLTADRPSRFRNTGSPQSIAQQNIFGKYALTASDNWNSNMPLHINVPLEEPEAGRMSPAKLVIEVAPTKQIRSEDTTRLAEDTSALQDFLSLEGELCVLVGTLKEELRGPVKSFLDNHNLPVYAESTSGLRESVNSIPSTDISGTRILRIGAVPSCRFWRELEKYPEVNVFSVASNGLPGLARNSKVVKRVNWQDLTFSYAGNSTKHSGDKTDELLDEFPLSETSWIRLISELIPRNSLVFLGNSLPVREWELAATKQNRGLRCFSNRGANGIDGCISTFLGLSANEKESWAIIGDLTALYDLSSPWIIKNKQTGNCRIVIINNGGGKIFSRLKSLRAATNAVKEVIENPHNINFRYWAKMWDLQYRKVTSAENLTGLPSGTVVIEVFPDADQTEKFWSSLNDQ